MTTFLALDVLYDAVVAQFAADSTSVENTFGWREPDLQYVNPRIAWVPGDEGGVVTDPLIAARGTQANPRQLGNLPERFHVVISADDPTAPVNERLQWRSVRLVFDAWYRAIYLAAHGTVFVESARWIIDKKVRRNGAAMIVECYILSPLLDLPVEVVGGAGTGASIDITELDVIEPVVLEVT